MELQNKTGRLFDAYPDLAREYAKRLHRKKEDIEFVQKFFVSEKAEAVGAERAIISHITTESVDRDNEVLLPSGMKADRYEKSGKPVFWGHDYAEPRTVVGQCQWLKADPKKKGIIAKTAFRNTEFADEVYQLYTEDLTGQGPILKGFSVGFIPLEWETGKKDGDPRRTFTAWELLEYSFVSIPCNADAVTVLEQKGIKLCSQLRKDLGVPEKGTNVTEKDTEDLGLGKSMEIDPDTKADAKILDEDKNPSEYDIISAIQAALNGQGSGELLSVGYRSVLALFPVDYPSGHCVWGRRDNDDTYHQYRQDYTFADGKAELIGEPVEVVVTYQDKAVPVTETKNVTPADSPAEGMADLASALAALNARLDGIEARLAPPPSTPPVATPPNAPLPVIDPDAVDVIDIEPEPDVLDIIDAPAPVTQAPSPAPKSVPVVTEADVLAAIDRLDLQSIIKQNVDLALDKLRGRVR